MDEQTRKFKEDFLKSYNKWVGVYNTKTTIGKVIMKTRTNWHIWTCKELTIKDKLKYTIVRT